VEFRDRLAGSRRQLARTIWDRGVARGELHSDADPEVAMGLVFGPAMCLLVAPHAPLDDADDEIVEMAMHDLAC
jgi:hypothetical protein